MGVTIAWGLGMGIITWRWAKAGAPPTPGAYATASGFFALAVLLAAYPPARTAATLAAFGIDVAAFLQILGKAPAAQDTGWPPLPINDPTVLLPAGGSGGQIVPEGAGASGSGGTGTGAPGTPTSGGKCPPGFPPGMICAG
jgi:hypothetical protein